MSNKFLSTVGVLFVVGVMGLVFVGGPGSQESRNDLAKDVQAVVSSGARLAGEMVSPPEVRAAGEPTLTPGLQQKTQVAEMNQTATSALEEATTDKLGFFEQAYLKSKYGPVTDMILVGYGVDKTFFKPQMKAEMEPFIQQVADNSVVATEALDMAGKNQASTLTLAEIQLNKDERWTPEEAVLIARMGYDAKNGIFLTKAAENEQQQIDKKAAELAEENGKKFTILTERQKRTAGALARLKKSIGGAHRDGNTWVLPLKADRVFEGNKTVVK